jgi:hypothetical protein
MGIGSMALKIRDEECGILHQPDPLLDLEILLSRHLRKHNYSQMGIMKGLVAAVCCLDCKANRCGSLAGRQAHRRSRWQHKKSYCFSISLGAYLFLHHNPLKTRYNLKIPNWRQYHRTSIQQSGCPFARWYWRQRSNAD